MTRSDSPQQPEYPEAFVLAVRAAAASVGWQYRGADAEGLEFVDGKGVRQSIGLPRFFQRFRDHDPAQWPERLAGYLRQVIAITARPDNDDLNSQAGQVFVRLHTPIPKIPAVGVWSRPFSGTGLEVILVIADSDSFRFVRQEMIDASGRAAEEWCGIGLENLRRCTPSGSLRVIHPESGLLGCQVGDDHDGSRALLLESLLSEPAPHGVLAAAPDRGSLLVLPLSAPLRQYSLALLKVLSGNIYAEASHKLSDRIFWVKDGVWRPFGIDVGQDGVSIQPPPEMAADLQALTAPGESRQG